MRNRGIFIFWHLSGTISVYYRYLILRVWFFPLFFVLLKFWWLFAYLLNGFLDYCFFSFDSWGLIFLKHVGCNLYLKLLVKPVGECYCCRSMWCLLCFYLACICIEHRTLLVFVGNWWFIDFHDSISIKVIMKRCYWYP